MSAQPSRTAPAPATRPATARPAARPVAKPVAASHPPSTQATIGGEVNALSLEVVRAGYTKLTRIFVTVCALFALSLLGNLYQLSIIDGGPKAVYFGLTTDGRVYELSELNAPTMDDPGLVDWVARTVPSVYRFDFGNYIEQLQTAGQKYFTEDGYNAFIAELGREKGILSVVKENRLVVRLAVSGVPSVVGKGNLADGVYAWKVELPVSVSYLASGAEKTETGAVALTIVRSNEHRHAVNGGVAIHSFVIKTSH